MTKKVKITQPQYYILEALINEVQRLLEKTEALSKIAQELTFLDDKTFQEIEDMFYIRDDYNIRERLKRDGIVIDNDEKEEEG